MTADEELATKFRNVAETGDGMVSVHLLSQAADALDRLTAENAQLKRWFADESAHAQEAVKEIAKLREALTKVRADVNERCANQERTMGHAMSWLDYIKQDIDAALASHTEPPTWTKDELDRHRREMDPDQFRREYMAEFPPIPKYCEGCARLESRSHDDRMICNHCCRGESWIEPASHTTGEEGGER